MHPTCPQCSRPVTTANLSTLTADNHKVIAFSCPHCNSIFSMQMDPVTVSSELFDRVKRLTADIESSAENRIRHALSKLEQRLR